MENIVDISAQYIGDVQIKSIDNVQHLQKLPDAGVELTDCAKEAHLLIDKVIANSSNHFLEHNQHVPDIPWLAVKDFTIENGVNKIHEFIQVNSHSYLMTFDIYSFR